MLKLRDPRICSACGSDSRVTDARVTHKVGYFRRRRLCLNNACQHRWTTVEILVEELDRVTRNTQPTLVDVISYIAMAVAFLSYQIIDKRARLENEFEEDDF